MKFSFYFKNEKQENQKYVDALSHCLTQNGDEIDDLYAEIIIVIGGDGTFLEAIQHYKDRLSEVSFLGLGVGDFSFLYDFKLGDMTLLYQAVKEKKLKTYSYPLLECEYEKERFLAFNDFRFTDDNHPLHFVILIDGEQLEVLSASGLCFSTPLGSSAFTKSNSGALLFPTIKGIEMTEIQALSNCLSTSLHSPLIIDEKCEIQVVIDSAFNFHFDSNTFKTSRGGSLLLRRAKEKVHFLRPRNYSYLISLRKGFIK